MLIKYIDPALVESGDAPVSGISADDGSPAAGEKPAADKPLVLVINESSDKLTALKEVLSPRYKGVFVKNEADAQKFLAKHHVEFIIRDGQ